MLIFAGKYPITILTGVPYFAPATLEFADRRVRHRGVV